MKDKIHTIPIREAFESGDECPFCRMEREAEQRSIRFFAGPGASYMEPQIRSITTQAGFCRQHMKGLYDYGNALGSALMLQSYYACLLNELQSPKNREIPPKKSRFRRRKQQTGTSDWQRLQERVDSCVICDRVADTMARYWSVFFDLLAEEEFRHAVENSKGFCLRHFAQLLQMAEELLPQARREWFYPAMYTLMDNNLRRVKKDLDWFVAKHDYRNAEAPWHDSLDALPRAMQKLEGLYPADPPYRKD